jgi:Flp pilus assembly protein TadG
MKITRKKIDITHDQRGQSLVEFALVVPILLLLFLGILQFGVAFNHYLTLTDAVRVGARKAAVSRLESDQCGPVQQAVRDNRGGLDPAELDIPCPSSSWTPGGPVTVTATYPLKIDILGVVVKQGRMTSSATERVE